MKTSPAQAGFAVKLHLAFMFTVRQPENGFICLIHNIHNANTHNKRKHHEITNRTNPYPHHPAHARQRKSRKKRCRRKRQPESGVGVRLSRCPHRTAASRSHRRRHRHRQHPPHHRPTTRQAGPRRAGGKVYGLRAVMNCSAIACVAHDPSVDNSPTSYLLPQHSTAPYYTNKVGRVCLFAIS